MMDLSRNIDANDDLNFDFDEINNNKKNKYNDDFQKEGNFKDNNSSDILVLNKIK